MYIHTNSNWSILKNVIEMGLHLVGVAVTYLHHANFLATLRACMKFIT